MTWEAITALSTAITGIVIVVTAFVAVDQLRQFRAQRRDAAAVEVMRSLQDPDFSRAFSLIIALPAGISAADFRALGPAYTEAAQILALRFEMLGVLVHRGAVDFEVTEDLCGGGIVAAWQRIKAMAVQARDSQNYPMYLEWFQWVAEQYEKRGRLSQTAAHERHRDWTPARRT